MGPIWPKMSHITSFSLKYHISTALFLLRPLRDHFTIDMILLFLSNRSIWMADPVNFLDSLCCGLNFYFEIVTNLSFIIGYQMYKSHNQLPTSNINYLSWWKSSGVSYESLISQVLIFMFFSFCTVEKKITFKSSNIW